MMVCVYDLRIQMRGATAENAATRGVLIILGAEAVDRYVMAGEAGTILRAEFTRAEDPADSSSRCFLAGVSSASANPPGTD